MQADFLLVSVFTKSSRRVQHVDLCHAEVKITSGWKKETLIAQMKTIIITVLFRCRIRMEITEERFSSIPTVLGVIGSSNII